MLTGDRLERCSLGYLGICCNVILCLQALQTSYEEEEDHLEVLKEIHYVNAARKGV